MPIVKKHLIFKFLVKMLSKNTVFLKKTLNSKNAYKNYQNSYYLKHNHQKYQKNIKSALLYVLGVLGMLLITMPAYIPQLYFGYINLTVEIDGISLWHRIYIYIGIIIPFAVYFALRNKDEQTKRFVLLFMSLGGLITFMCDAKYMTWLDVCSWPIHLCHTAMYIIPLCLIFKWN